MAWQALDRKAPAHDDSDKPLLDDAVKEKIRSFFPRYPTKLAVMLPALHVVQDKYGYISHRAMRDIAEVLEVTPAQVLSTISFYTHYWQHPKGKKLIVACRSLSCELMGAKEVNDAIAQKLGVGEHGTSTDGQYSFVTEECLGACEFAPCLLVNEKLHKCVKVSDVPKLLADAKNDKLDIERSDLYDAPAEKVEEALVGTTSDVEEMKNAE
jgi:NADH-quinone oxidoreductase subunit E